jgi:hypothetical protein
MVLIDPSRIRVAMHVVGVDGHVVGVVKAVDAVASRVDRPFRRDIYIPHFAVPDVVGDYRAARHPRRPCGRHGLAHALRVGMG